MTEPRVRISLVENATDSLVRAIQVLAWDDHGLGRAAKYKQSVQLAAHGLELILKARLHEIHPALVWENIDRYPDLDARTVSSDQALQRLERIGGLSFSDDDKALLKSLRRARNAVEHLAWDISEREANVLLARSISLAVAFCAQQLAVELVEYGDHKDGLMDDFMSKFPGVLATPHSFMRTDVDTCPRCRGEAFVRSAGECEKCGYSEVHRSQGTDVEEDDYLPF